MKNVGKFGFLLSCDFNLKVKTLSVHWLYYGISIFMQTILLFKNVGTSHKNLLVVEKPTYRRIPILFFNNSKHVSL